MRKRYRAILCDLFGTLVDGNGVAMEGAVELVEQLADARWAIVTSCSAHFARRLLRQARLRLPPVLVSFDDVVETKPAPGCYLRAAELLGVRPSACLVIEDSSGGIAAGKAAEMDVVAVQRSGRALSRADATIANLRQLRVETTAGGEIVIAAGG